MKKKIYVLVSTQQSDKFRSYPEVETFAEYETAHKEFLLKVKDTIEDWVSEYGEDNVKLCHSESGNNGVVNYFIENSETTTEPHFDIYDVRDCVLKSESVYIRETYIEIEDTPTVTPKTESISKTKRGTNKSKAQNIGVVVEEEEGNNKPRKNKKKVATE